MDILDKACKMFNRNQPSAYDLQVNKVVNAQGQTPQMLCDGKYPKDNPLTHTGKQVMAKMKKEYGSEKGKRVFYATANKNKKLGKKLHK